MRNQLDRRVFGAFFGRFSQLREAQEAAIEPLISGRNIVLTSGTGSGKTEAVVAPLVSRYWIQAIKTDSLFLLYIAPTKALVNDLEKRLDGPLTSLGIRVGVRHGDRDDLNSGPKSHVLITTPESLEVLLFRGEVALTTIQAVIIDEVHLLYNTQRGLQLSILLRRLRKILPDGLQWAALSATIGNLSHVRDFLVGENEEADLLTFPSERTIDAQIRHVRSITDFQSIISKLIDGHNAKLLIFANSRRECERLASALQQLDSLKHFVFAHYSSLAPQVRIETEKKFSSMGTAICIATSTLELGIDIGDIDAVMLWDVPSGVDSFLQRIGRSNRRTNKTNVVCLISDESASISVDALRFAALVDAAKKGELPTQEPYELFGAICQQCLSVIGSEGGRFMKISDLCDLLTHKSYITRDTVEFILSELASKGFLQRHGYKNRYGADEGLHKLVDMKMIYGNYGVGSQTVDLFHGAKCLGEVPAINILRIRAGDYTRFAGKCWQVKKISRDGIHLVPSKPTNDIIDFLYGGGGIPSDPHIANRVWHLIHSDDLALDLFSSNLRKNVEFIRKRVKSICSESQIPYVRDTEGIQYYTFAGYLINRAIGLIAGKSGFKANDFALFVSSPINWSSIPIRPLDYENVFNLLFEMSSRQSIYQMQLPLDLQEREFIQGWIKDLEIPSILKRLANAATFEIDKDTVTSLGYLTK